MDASPLIGTRTGIGVFVAELVGGLAALSDVEVAEYTLSVGARRAGVVRGSWVPLPAGSAPAVWRVTRGPRIERFTGPVDVVHGTNYLVPPSRARRVVSVYDLSYLHDADSVAPSVARFDRAVRWAVDGGAIVHTMSHHVADEIRERYRGARVVVVPGGVAPRARPASSPGGPPVVLALGTTGRRKRIPLLVEAFGAIAERCDAVLRIVGPEGEDEAAVAAAIADLPAAARGRVVRVGVVDDAGRDAELAGAAVLAYPSDYEGFGFPVLEAMASGTAVVTTDAGSLPEVSGDAAVVVETGDAEALAVGLTSVLEDEGRRHALVEAGLRRAARFTWEGAVEGMMELYRGEEPPS